VDGLVRLSHRYYRTAHCVPIPPVSSVLSVPDTIFLVHGSSWFVTLKQPTRRILRGTRRPLSVHTASLQGEANFTICHGQPLFNSSIHNMKQRFGCQILLLLSWSLKFDRGISVSATTFRHQPSLEFFFFPAHSLYIICRICTKYIHSIGTGSWMSYFQRRNSYIFFVFFCFCSLKYHFHSCTGVLLRFVG
jgi:hypothetical protein